MSNENNLRPAFFYHLGNASEASEIVDNFDINGENSEEYKEKEKNQAKNAITLINFIVKNADSLKRQLGG